MAADAELLDLEQLLEQNFRGVSEKHIDLAHRCTRNTSFGTFKCTYSVINAFKTAQGDLGAELDETGGCSLCYNCFVDGKCTLEKGCETHSASAAKQDTEGDVLDANEERQKQSKETEWEEGWS